ncbi:solute carrier family 2, facilitated glucose transporter member 11 isoform X1 [Polypterus senegalus]|uniref:solute carrier family 2, facilitated glucose transporter member 11 isoform X1 n=1 Tax=Polypterus senegalus TaxID=55291 RepID=UPI0019633A5A|nr:solute carrier family 2, facilitated glucose transporter member 11 isoform X1 [Polypterus senegalus]
MEDIEDNWTDNVPNSEFQGKILIFIIFAAGIGGTFQYGYSLSTINAPTTYIQTFINETWLERWGTPLESPLILMIWSFIVSIYSLGGLLGALIAGPMAVQFGRKKSLLVNNVFIIISASLVIMSKEAQSFEMIMISRLFGGINAGVGMNIQPMYLGESAPMKLRGAAALSSAPFAALGILLGQIIGLREILGSEACWPFLLSSNVIPALLQLATLPWLPESPRYLLIDKGDKHSCRKALQMLRGTNDIDKEMEEMQQEQAAITVERAMRPWELFRDRTVRYQLITVIVISSAMQLCGNDSMYFYASYVFQKAGIPSDKIQYYILITGGCELFMAVTANLFIERLGRRLLMLLGYIMMTVWAVIFTVALSLQDKVSWMPYMSMVCIFAYILSFGIGPAGVTGLLPTEIFDQAARPAAYMISGSLIWSMLFVIGMGFPFIVGGLGVFCYIPFGIVCILAAVFVAFFLPETKGKSLLEISQEYNELNFKGKKSQNTHYQLGEMSISTKL